MRIITIDYKIFLDLIIYGDFSAGDLGTHQHMTRTLMNRYGLVLFRMMWSSPSLRNTGSQTHKPECLDLPVALRLQARKVAFTPRLQMVATNLSWRRKPGSAPQVWKTWRSLTILKAPRLVSCAWSTILLLIIIKVQLNITVDVQYIVGFRDVICELIAFLWAL